MRTLRRSFWLSALLLLLISVAVSAGERVTLNFNPDWRFIKADPAGALKTDFDDKDWAVVSAPHTYNDVDTFDDWSLVGHRGEQNQWGGRTWYRKTFVVPANWQGKKVFIEFESARQIAEVYLNGQLLGTHKIGFTPFGFELTPHLRAGEPNVLAVMCDNRFMVDPNSPAAIEASNKSGAATAQKDAGPSKSLAQLSAEVNKKIPEGVDVIQGDQIPWNNPHWHPAHGGLYRNVKLYVTDPLHISLPLYSFLKTAGPYVYATDISADSAKVAVEVPIQNGRANAENVELNVSVLDGDNRPVLSLKQNANIDAGADTSLAVSGELKKPQLWEPDYPHLYRVVCTLRAKGEVIDSCEVPLGIRTVRWDTNDGFFINGRPLRLRGWGQKPTDEWPGLGAAQPAWMHFLTLKLVKDVGGNFVRWGHCAGGPVQIAACDRLGLIVDQPGVDGEADTRAAAWDLRSAAFRDAVIYYRNNPSILIWEGGNQKVSREHAQELSGFMNTYDPHGGRAYAHRRADKISAEFMTVGIGTEGGREIKELPVVEGEYNREEAPRRVWDDFSPPNFGYPEAKGQTYQLTSEQFAVNQVTHWVRKILVPGHCGGANWIFSDSTSGGRVGVEVCRNSGEVDGVRLPKEAYFACQAMFRDDPQVHIIGHWTYPEGTKKAIYVVSNAEEVELQVNGKSIGRASPTDRYLFTFPDVAWQPGEVKALAFSGGQRVATQAKLTTGPAVKLQVTPLTGPGGFKADGSDVVLFDVEALDENGKRCPTFQQRVDFELEGPALWRGGYNSGKINSINNAWLDLECGINRVAVRSTLTRGMITLRAKSDGIQPASVTIEALPVRLDNGASPTMSEMPVVHLVPQRGPAVTETVPRISQGTVPVETKGRFVRSFSYSGPSPGVRVEQDARSGKKPYLDLDMPFANLPAELNGSDYIQAANVDRLFNAVDLMEIAVKSGTIVWVAHDDRLERPDWLTRQFQPTEQSVVLDGKPMKLFQRKEDREESLTLGTNTENAQAGPCNMYIVFVNAATR